MKRTRILTPSDRLTETVTQLQGLTDNKLKILQPITNPIIINLANLEGFRE
ncbi:hypothetical protein [Scytonema hofmannii]|uniref:hypothetical protein n=1 Tax=Scytonema hofmannii TaxID=34078 RepID=UPI00034CE5DD|nr:hypothetical protein [Scytonema hofmannii]